MQIGEAKRITGGGLGKPSKMPGTSYGLPAKACHVGAKLAKVEGSVCHGCYALKGNYLYPSVQTAQERRLASITDPQWVDAMVTLLNHSGTGWHRWHDSGDLQSVDHLLAISDICRATPHIQHWLPTREIMIVKACVARLAAFGRELPSNLCVRVSATMIDGKATKVWDTTSGVHTEPTAAMRVCPAPTQGNKCGDCRACWDKSVSHVSYHKH